MKVTITKIESPFYGKYELNNLITFNYFDRETTAIVTKKARDFLKVHHLRVGQEIEVVKHIKNNKIMYVVTKVY